MIEARYHDSVNVVQALSASAQAAPSPFDRAEWYALIAASGIAPLIVTADAGAASAMLVLTQNNRRIRPLSNWYAFTWRPLITGGQAGEDLLAVIAKDLKNRGFRVTLEPVPDEDGSASRIARAFRKAGWQVSVETCDINHVLPVSRRSFADYWKDRPGSLRSTLKRKGNKVTTEVLTRFVPKAWDAYEQIYAASWKPEEGAPAMLRAFAKAEGDAGRLRLGLARYDGIPVAAQFWTVERDIAYIHKLAHLESHRHLSAGTTLSAALFAHVIDHDAVELVDFGTGDQIYKSDWMEAVRPRFRIDCLDPAQVRAWVPLAKRRLRALRGTPAATLAPAGARG